MGLRQWAVLKTSSSPRKKKTVELNYFLDGSSSEEWTTLDKIAPNTGNRAIRRCLAIEKGLILLVALTRIERATS